MKGSGTPRLSDTFSFCLKAGARALTIEHTVYSIMAGLIVEVLFCCFSIYSTV